MQRSQPMPVREGIRSATDARHEVRNDARIGTWKKRWAKEGVHGKILWQDNDP